MGVIKIGFDSLHGPALNWAVAKVMDVEKRLKEVAPREFVTQVRSSSGRWVDANYAEWNIVEVLNRFPCDISWIGTDGVLEKWSASRGFKDDFVHVVDYELPVAVCQAVVRSVLGTSIEIPDDFSRMYWREREAMATKERQKLLPDIP